MAQDLNVVTLAGRVVAEPRSAGAKGAKFRFVNNRARKQGDDWIEESLFFDCVMFGDRASSVLEKVTKGAKVLVTGRLAPDNYEKDDGTRVERIQIILNEWQLLDPVDKAAKSSKDAKGGKAAKQTVPPSEEEEEEAPF